MANSIVTTYLDQAEGLRVLAKQKNAARLADFHSALKKNKHRKQIWSLASGKGGVGKSSLCLNLGILLAALGRRTLIFDADLGLSNIHILSGCKPEHTLSQALSKQLPLRRIIHQTQWGVDFISSGTALRELQQLGAVAKKNLMQELSALEEYELILIDLGAGIGEAVLSFVELSQKLLLVSTPEPTALADAYGLLKALSRQGTTLTFHLLMNRAYSLSQGRAMAERMIKLSAVKLKEALLYSGTVLKDEAVVKASYLNVPFVKGAPSTPATLCLKQVAKYLNNFFITPELNSYSQPANNFS